MTPKMTPKFSGLRPRFVTSKTQFVCRHITKRPPAGPTFYTIFVTLTNLNLAQSKGGTRRTQTVVRAPLSLYNMVVSFLKNFEAVLFSFKALADDEVMTR